MTTELPPSLDGPPGSPAQGHFGQAAWDAPKPRLRGVSHELAFYVSLAAGALLIATAPAGHTLGLAIFASSLTALLGTSALFHRRQWGPLGYALLRRLDHAAIFLLIAGSYTPICLLTLPPERAHRLLLLVWLGAGLGVGKSLLWPRATRAVTVPLSVGIGILALLEWDAISAGAGPSAALLLVAGGVAYLLGAVVYTRRRPDPFPAVFGYHEIFHALVVLAGGLHFAAIALLARA